MGAETFFFIFNVNKLYVKLNTYHYYIIIS